jgi:hypothetical protein
MAKANLTITEVGKPGDKARMTKMRIRRAPFTDPRDSRLKRQVRSAFCGGPVAELVGIEGGVVSGGAQPRII